MTEKPIIPVYLNQRIVFDLLAMLEGGLCHVTRVVSAENKTGQNHRRYGAEFGLSKALEALLSINLTGERQITNGTNETRKTDEERIHTPASLFFRLRNRLKTGNLLKLLDKDRSPEVHDLVEFGASMLRNPLLQTMDSLVALMEMAVLFEDQGTGQKGQQKGHPRQTNDRIIKQMKNFTEKLRGGDTVDMIAEKILGEQRAILTLETEYLNDPTMADLVDGKFTVVGKVIRSVPSGEAISLIRKSALAVTPYVIIDVA